MDSLNLLKTLKREKKNDFINSKKGKKIVYNLIEFY